jgi:hypothetical protein
MVRQPLTAPRARARSRMGACALVGLAAWGARRAVGPVVGGLVSRMGSFSRGLDFGK